METECITYRPSTKSIIKENKYRKLNPRNVQEVTIKTSGSTSQNNVNVFTLTGNHVHCTDTIDFIIDKSSDREQFIDFSKSYVQLNFSFSTAETSLQYVGIRFQRGSGSIFNNVQFLTKNGTVLENIPDYHMVQALHTAVGSNTFALFEDGLDGSSGVSHNPSSVGSMNAVGNFLFVGSSGAAGQAGLTGMFENKGAGLVSERNKTYYNTSTHRFLSKLFGKYSTKWIPFHKHNGYVIRCGINNFVGAFQTANNSESYSLQTIKLRPVLYLKTYSIEPDIMGQMLRSSALNGTITIPFHSTHIYSQTLNIELQKDYMIDIPLYLKNIQSFIFGFNSTYEMNGSHVADAGPVYRYLTGNNMGQTNVSTTDVGIYYSANFPGAFKPFYTTGYGPCSFSNNKDGTPNVALRSYNLLLNNELVMVDDIILKTNPSTAFARTTGGFALQSLHLNDALQIDPITNFTILGCRYDSPLQITYYANVLKLNMAHINWLHGLKIHDFDGSHPPSITLKLNFDLISTTNISTDNLICFFICQNHYYLNLDTGESSTEF